MGTPVSRRTDLPAITCSMDQSSNLANMSTAADRQPLASYSISSAYPAHIHIHVLYTHVHILLYTYCCVLLPFPWY
ncbi:hypothetical protein BDZ91DRAFT_718173 [Kalaharituber pfeilii]|nr:hypothetical protein BDZ91DRAFT_718173 [Kalaharituber pfeilii]